MGIGDVQPRSELRAARQRCKRTLAEQAKRFGISGQALGRYELGLRIPRDPGIQQKIYDEFGIAPHVLMGVRMKKVRVRGR